MTKRTLILTLLATALFAADKPPVDPVNKNSAGLAIKGYDAVAYFTESKPVKGSPQFTAEWNGARWQFASQEHRDMFQGEPAKYAPQYGGYCAWAVGHNYTADADPQAWKIVDGKLYLNYNKAVQDKWSPDAASKWIPDANKNWSGLHK